MAKDTSKDFTIEPVAIMASSEGYQYLEEFISIRLKSILTRLQVDDFSSLSEVALLQGEIRGLRAVVDYVNTRVKKNKGE